MKIQVLGSGCPTCKKLYDLTKQAAGELKLDDEVEYVTDVEEIVKLGLMSSPVLVIDGKPVIVGMVPDISKLKDKISAVIK